jgi:hypothetical protein
LLVRLLHVGSRQMQIKLVFHSTMDVVGPLRPNSNPYARSSLLRSSAKPTERKRGRNTWRIPLLCAHPGILPIPVLLPVVPLNVPSIERMPAPRHGEITPQNLPYHGESHSSPSRESSFDLIPRRQPPIPPSLPTCLEVLLTLAAPAPPTTPPATPFLSLNGCFVASLRYTRLPPYEIFPRLILHANKNFTGPLEICFQFYP